MIRSLKIKNYALIENLEIDFSDGLTIITGETGAGKSILLGALGLIMGKRADTKVLYDGGKKCVVEGFFDISNYKLRSFFDANDIDYEEDCVLRRELTPSGKSRAFVNDTPVNLNILRQLCGALIDLHQQFDSLDIHKVSFQLRMLDALAANKDLLERFQELYRSWRQEKKQLADLLERDQNAAKEIDFLNFQMEEFREAKLAKGEQEALEAEQNKLTNAEDIKRILAEAFQRLSENEPSLVGQLEDVLHSVGSLKDFHESLPELFRRFEGLVLEVQDVAQEFEKIAAETEYDGERILEIQERLDLIYRLLNKHHVATVAELLAIQRDLQGRLDAFGDLSAEIEALEARVDEREAQMTKVAKELSRRRREVVPGFEKKVKKLLTQLVMEHAQFTVEIQGLDEFSLTGLDEVHFLFSANKGSRLQHIKDVASGGELSRLTLVTKSLVAKAIPLPTLIFDEIDSGISGDVSLKMGAILRKLSNHHQVVSITHSPQIASKADAHYFVYKKLKNNRTITKVKLLSKEEEVRAIATMLSQSPPTASAIDNAKELLSLAVEG